MMNKFFIDAAKQIANRANIKAKCYVESVGNKSYIKKIIYKQKNLPTITLIVTKKDLIKGHIMIVALLEANNKLITKNPEINKIVIGRIKPKENKVKYIKKNKKINQKDSAKKPRLTANKDKPFQKKFITKNRPKKKDMIKKRAKPLMSKEENKKLVKEMKGGSKNEQRIKRKRR